jgi:hypothetical protein
MNLADYSADNLYFATQPPDTWAEKERNAANPDD